MREEELVRQLIELIGELEMDQGFIKKKFEAERERARQFQKQFFGVKKPELPKIEFDPKQYATYVLTQGSLEEKREFLTSIKSKIYLSQKTVSLQ